MNLHTQKYLIDGPVGKIELTVDAPDHWNQPGAATAVRGVALVAHPHPLFGGTMENKVTFTLARTFVQLGYLAVRPNFRGVGASAGQHDEGVGEQDDLIAVIDHIQAQLPTVSTPLPLVLAGFSFGTFVLSHVAQRLKQQGISVQRLVFVGTAASRWQVASVPDDTIVIHGEQDDTVPISAVYDWARPQQLPVIVIPGADHFFHRKLHLLKRIITDAWRV